VEKVDFDLMDKELEDLHAELAAVLGKLIKLSDKARRLQELVSDIESYRKYIENTVADAKLLLKQFK
jgi:uncharacterized protein involved in exopolysaccharide biosynthesis